MASFTALLGTPFFTGGSVVAAVGPSETGGTTSAPPNTVVLDGYVFPVEMRDWRSGPLDTFRDTIVANDQPSDALFNARGAWSRYRYSWHQGAGQVYGDLADTALPFRFLSSYGLDWTEEYQLTLAKSTALSKAGTGSNILLQRCGDYLFMADGTKLYRTSDLTSWTTCSDPGGTIQALSTDGTDLYVATTTVMVKYVAGATSSTAFGTAVTGNCTNVAFCSNRLLLAKGNALYEVAAAGTLTPIKTHFQSAFLWTTIFNIGSRIYIGGYAGARSELHTVTTDSSGALVQSQEAAPLPMGELLRGGYSYAGGAFLLTSNGVRTANVGGDGTLSYGPLIDELGDVRCAVADGRYLFVGWSDMGDGRSGAARLVLDDEVQPLLPAWGGDVSEASASGSVTGVARLGGRTVFAVAGSGAWAEATSSYATQGELDAGKLTFGTVEPKALTGIDVYFSALVADEIVEVRIYDEDGALIGSGSASTVGDTRLTVDLGGIEVGTVNVRLLLAGGGTTTPTVFRWRMRAYPKAPATFQWLLPLIVGDDVIIGDGEGQLLSMNIDDVVDWIEDLYSSHRYTVLRHGSRSYSVRLENYEWRPSKWTDDGGNPQGQLVVQLIRT